MWRTEKTVVALVITVILISIQLAEAESENIRPGHATYGNTCWWIRSIPDEVRRDVGLNSKYKKYTEAYGIPIVSTNIVTDEALTRACYLTTLLFASRMEIRAKYYEIKGFIEVLGENEYSGRIPSYCAMPVWWKKGHLKNWNRARDVEPSKEFPITTIAEENLLCSTKPGEMEWYAHEEFSVHMMAHTVQFVLEMIDDRFESTLIAIFKNAVEDGLWQNTYAARNEKEYFAEGVQSYFGINVERKGTDGVHNGVNGRKALMGYDPILYNFIKTIFTCDNVLIKKCDDDFVKTRYQNINQCGKITGDGAKEPCVDNSHRCKTFAMDDKWCYKTWVAAACQKSCKVCLSEDNFEYVKRTKVTNIAVESATTKSQAKIAKGPKNEAKTSVESTKDQGEKIDSKTPSGSKSSDTDETKEIVDENHMEVVEKRKCHDRSRFCQSFSREGKCFRAEGYILTICPKSCNVCTCKDYIDVEPNCAKRATKEPCNSAYMTLNCQKTCEKCPRAALEMLSKFTETNSCQHIKTLLQSLNMEY